MNIGCEDVYLKYQSIEGISLCNLYINCPLLKVNKLIEIIIIYSSPSVRLSTTPMNPVEVLSYFYIIISIERYHNQANQ